MIGRPWLPEPFGQFRCAFCGASMAPASSDSEGAVVWRSSSVFNAARGKTKKHDFVWEKPSDMIRVGFSE